jgi:hypothetical protein
MELLRFEADAYCRLMSMIGQLLAHFQIAATAPASAGLSIESEVYGTLGETLREMEQQINKLDLPLAKRHFERMEAVFDSKDERPGALTNNDWLTRNLAELIARIIDELEERLFLSVPSSQAGLYLQPDPPFGADVAARFPNMTEDISESAKGLALDRATASVFHLMRVMELAVQEFGSVLGISLVTEKNWQVILDELNAAIRKLDQRAAKTKAYAEAASHLYNVKLAWRNEVMHPKQTYTFEEANAIFDNAKTFINDLAHIL